MERLIDNLAKFDNEMKTLKDFFDLIKKILIEWVDFNEPTYYDIVALWIVGTWFHDLFYSYPYLFINAMKQSGKTRLLKLISILSKKGFFTSNLTESVLFRLPASDKGVTLCIDEAERLYSKEKASLRELLNAGYKKGLYIARSRKLPNEKWIVDKFEMFTPIALANIGGIDDILEDRCIVIPLERSINKRIMSKLESFEIDPLIVFFNKNIDNLNLVYRCSVECQKGYIYYDNLLYTTYTTYTNIENSNNKQTEIAISLENSTPNYTLNPTPSRREEVIDTERTPFFAEIDKVINEGIIMGRYLEIWYPLLFLAYEVDVHVFTSIKNFISLLIKEKKELENMENRDLIFLSFLINNVVEENEFITIRSIVTDYKNNEPDDQWFNSIWVGSALKRHHLIKEKRRLNKGFEVILNFNRLKELAKKMNLEKEQKGVDEYG